MPLTKREIERAKKLQKQLSSRRGLIGRLAHPPKPRKKARLQKFDANYDAAKISKIFRDGLARDIVRTKRIIRNGPRN